MSPAERPPRIVLVRHAETEWSRSGRHTGSTDIPITEDGRRSLADLRHRFRECRFGTILTSPLLRARQTCEALGVSERADVREELSEWRYGRYEGLTPDEIQECSHGWDLWRDGAPDGESPNDVAARIDRMVDELRSTPPTSGDVLIVAHGHSLRVFAARWIGLPIQAGRNLRLAAGAVSILGWHRGTPVLWEWNVRCRTVTEPRT